MRKKILTLGMVLVLVSALALPGAVMAQTQTLTTEVTGSVPSEITFTAPNSVGLGSMAPGDTPHVAHSTGGKVIGNHAAGYTVTGVDAKTPNKGKMTSNGNALANTLQIGPAPGELGPANEAQEFLSTVGPTDEDFELHVSQLVTLADPSGDYTIIITFTMTEN